MYVETFDNIVFVYQGVFYQTLLLTDVTELLDNIMCRLIKTYSTNVVFQPRGGQTTARGLHVARETCSCSLPKLAETPTYVEFYETFYYFPINLEFYENSLFQF